MSDGSATQLIQKEWPETIARVEKSGRKGNFDVVVLSPEALARSNTRAFRLGRIAPAIVIEVGLDYGHGHLAGDFSKLLNSEVFAGFIIHLYRGKFDTSVEVFIEEHSEHERVKIAYAATAGRRARTKHVCDVEISERSL